MNKTRLFIIMPFVLAVGLIFGAWVNAGPPASNTVQSNAPNAVAAQLGTAFTYQGRLEDGGVPANGGYDFKVELYDAAAGGSKVGSTLTLSGVQVQDGLFILDLDFGEQYTGQELWLELQVRQGGGSYSKLSPRQPLTGSPYALGLRPGAVVESSGPVGFSVKANAAPNQIALYGEANQDGSVAVYGNSENNTGVFGNSNTGRGVWGQSIDDEGVYGYSANYDGVKGVAGGDSSFVAGVSGIAYGIDNRGVSGFGVGNNVGVYGYSPGLAGVYGESDSGRGVVGKSRDEYGVLAISGNHDGVRGDSYGSNRAGVYGINYAASGIGVRGQADVAGGVGVYGSSTANTGVYGVTSQGTGVWGSNGGSNTTGWAGYFDGRVTVNGNFINASGSSMIDHPLDPENMVLQHAVVESPDMMNIYNGNITTDSQGYATVTMPDWFEALNGDFRYQLTVIGQFAQAIVAQELEGNQFIIQTDKPDVTVSWQVTGIRHDPWAEANRIEVELAKDEADLGLYLHPEAYGLPREEGITAQFDPGHPAVDDQQPASVD